MNIRPAKEGVTHELVSFAVNTRFGDLPEETIEIAKRCIVDGTAVILAGSTEPVAAILREFARDVSGAQEARTLGRHSMMVPVHLAAQVNGVAGHALDWDDTALSEERDRSVLIHPTIQPLCACYALGEQLGVSAQDFLTAFILGFEVQVKIAEAIGAEHFTGGRGFHSSGTIGTFGAAIASCKLLGLDYKRTSNAMAIASTMAAGVGANHGTMSKPLNMSRAAENGVTAARFAALGMDGPANALEAGRGFLEAFGGGYDPKKIIGRMGSPFAIVYPGTSIKPYPSGVVGHPGMDTMKRLVERHDIKPEDVDSIKVLTGSNVIEPGPLRILHANNELEAKFCVAFQMASIVMRRRAGLSEFADGFVRSPDCQEMQKRVSVSVDPEIDALGKGRIVSKIHLTTKDGETYFDESDRHYRGGPKNPLTYEEVSDKFRDASQNVLDAEDVETFLSLTKDFETLPKLGEFLDAVTA
ncbi:MAG: MmgE/PrpD family protein [Boseongicola sp. SB0676_bin_33]|nr:MmgE/PrpD family protein [Boseongicola sp. SB0676_bin_33]